MQPNKTKISLAIGAMFLGVHGTSMAASESFPITATTIADVVLSQETALDFGANIFVTTGTCVMNAATPAPTLIRVPESSATNEANYGELSGTSCIAGNVGTPGVYLITGAQGTDVNITLGEIATTAFNFSPNSNAIANYDGANSADTYGTLSTSTITTAALAATDEGSAATSDNGVLSGELVFTLGGTLTINEELTSETDYDDEQFTLSVTY